jgi:diguanylate cyclase (GGDEF)-like protein
MPLSEQQQSLLNATIMMVDDEPINNAIVQIYMEEEGYHKFVTVDDSTLAMSTLEDTRPDLLLLDLMMPEVSGFEILEQVRSHPNFKHLPVIILTASTDTESKLKALGLGATDFLAKPLDKSELGLRVRNTLGAKAYQDQLAYFDPLTKLPNRQLFLEELSWAMKGARRYDDHLSLLNIEIDNFSDINDTAGVDVGDEVLSQVAERIQHVIRECDILGRYPSDDDYGMKLFHFGRSVFSLVLFRMDSIERGAMIAGRIIEEIRAPLYVSGKELYVTASIGIASCPAEGDVASELLRLASSAKDYAKKSGGNTFQSSSDEINEMYANRLRLEANLHSAVRDQEFELYYQPKVDVSTEEILGAEALVRWNSKEGLVYPGEFIPLAEESGLILQLGEWCLVESFRQLKEWQDAGFKINLSVNLSAKQFTDKSFLPMLKQTLSSIGVDPAYLTLELTESLLIDNIDEKIKLLEELKSLGFKLSIDDFGTGYSSLSYLRILPVDELKIDRSFIMEVLQHEDSKAITSTIIYLAKSLRLLTVAEGVEEREHRDFLAELGCDQYQGFLFSRAVPAVDMYNMLSDKAEALPGNP